MNNIDTVLYNLIFWHWTVGRMWTMKSHTCDKVAVWNTTDKHVIYILYIHHSVPVILVSSLHVPR